MKVYIGFFVVALALAVGTAAAQDVTPPTAPVAPVAPAALKVFSEFGAQGGWSSAMKNSPFSAEEVNESVQTLADGNRIVHNSKSKMYRNSEGRIRRESKGGAGGSFGMSYSIAPSISIVDPVVRQKYELDSVLKTATFYDLKAAGEGLAVAGANLKATEETLAKLKAEGRLVGVSDAKAREELLEKLKAEGKLVTSANVATTVSPTFGGTLGGTLFGTFAGASPVALKSKFETKTEELGTRDFEGVTAEGTRRTTIIPVDAIGNERQIEVVYERWYSKDLGVVVYSKTTDPRTGEQTYKLTNINRSEPDPSLFAVPTEYRKVGQPGSSVRATTVRTDGAKTSASPRATTAPAKPTTGVGRP